MARLTLSLLGPFQALVDGEPAAGLSTAKVRALLAYLAVEASRPHTREALAALLWPDWPDRHALNNLRQALANLRATLHDRAPDEANPLLLVSRETIQFNRDSDHVLDVTEFERGVHGAGASEEERISTLAARVRLYRAPFLDGLSLDSAPFQEWLTIQREHWQREALAALDRLAELHEGRGEYPQEQDCARRALAIDAADERWHRRLMRILAQGGERSAALAQYQACVRALAEELGVEPDPETTALYEQIRRGALAAPPRAAAGHIHGSSLTADTGLRVPESPSLRVPEPPRPLFVARERELAQLEQWLDEALRGQGRVGFVVGEPGSGKTMLLREFAHRAMESHPELIVAGGTCNAYAGIGDPYLPFLEILQMLSGEVETRLEGSSITREQARRLWVLLPDSVSALLDHGPELIDLFIPGAALLARARIFAPGGGAWLTRLEERLAAKPPTTVNLQQVDLFECTTRVLQALARKHPLVLLLDDLQWADAGSMSLLFHLGRRLAGQRVLIVGAYRPGDVALGRDGQRHPLDPVIGEFQRTWGEITVDLGEAEGRRLVEALVDQEPNRLGKAFRDTLYRHTEGHALFTVELLRGLQERGDLQRDGEGLWVESPSLDWKQRPTRAEAVIGESLKRLTEEERAFLTIASVEGEEFHAEVLARVQGADPHHVIRILSSALSRRHRLVMAQSVRQISEQRLSCYRFRHYLFQRHLYDSLDEVQRTDLHEQVGLALETLHGATPRVVVTELSMMSGDPMRSIRDSYGGPMAETTVIAAQLARHFRFAGLTSRAVSYLRQAAERAMHLRAWEEALVSLTQGVSLLASLPETPQRARTEYVVQILLGLVLAPLQGAASPQRGLVVARALELAQRIGDTSLIRYAMGAQAMYFRRRAQLREALEMETRLLGFVQDEAGLRSAGIHSRIAHTLFRLGEFRTSLTHAERSWAIWSSEGGPPALLPGLESLLHARWVLGFPDSAWQAHNQYMELAHGDQWHRAQWLANLVAPLHQLSRDVRATGETAQELLDLTAQGEFPSERPIGLVFLGWAQAHSGQPEQGIATMRQGIDAWTSSGYRLLLSQLLALLAEGHALAGRAQEGLHTLAEALNHVERTEERYYEAELWRLKGELLLQAGPHPSPEGWPEPAFSPQTAWEREQDAQASEAEACFRRSIEVARGQEAKSWELRATTSLARLLRDQWRKGEAREMLAAVYGWFTEGFDTPDLVEARALLEELA